MVSIGQDVSAEEREKKKLTGEVTQLSTEDSKFKTRKAENNVVMSNDTVIMSCCMG